MKISELIIELERLRISHGDLPVTFPHGYHSSGEVPQEIAMVGQWNACTDKKSDDLFPTNHIHLS